MTFKLGSYIICATWPTLYSIRTCLITTWAIIFNFIESLGADARIQLNLWEYIYLIMYLIISLLNADFRVHAFCQMVPPGHLTRSNTFSWRLVIVIWNFWAIVMFQFSSIAEVYIRKVYPRNYYRKSRKKKAHAFFIHTFSIKDSSTSASLSTSSAICSTVFTNFFRLESSGSDFPTSSATLSTTSAASSTTCSTVVAVFSILSDFALYWRS